MKAQFVRRENGVVVERGNIVEILSTDQGWYRIIDDMGDACYIPGQYLDVVDWADPAPEIHYTEDDLVDGEAPAPDIDK